MIYYVDIDGTICTWAHGMPYADAEPYMDRIAHFNNLFDEGHEIHYWTARGSLHGEDYLDITLRQLRNWGVKATSISTGKPHYDYWIDDKAKNVDDYFDKEFKRDLETIQQIDLL